VIYPHSGPCRSVDNNCLRNRTLIDSDHC
jgi:hypothetical protein